jgi:alpha-1,4-digalacturonate transport system permease protein
MSTYDKEQEKINSAMVSIFWVLGLPLRVLDWVFNRLQSAVGQQNMGYIFVLPNLLIFGIFILFPMLLNFYYGFTSDPVTIGDPRTFIGVENFQRLFTCADYSNVNTCREDLFWRGILNTAWFVLFEVGLVIFFALVTALALNRQIIGRGFFRSVFFYPVLLSPVVVALIWKWILQTDNGILNGLLEASGRQPVSFLTNSGWAIFWVLVISTWAQMGFYTLILLAGLQAIPRELYETAGLDGASAWHQLISITLPLLLPTMMVVIVLSFIRSVQMFDLVYVLTGGGPGTATQLIVQYIRDTAVGDRRAGIAAAASLVLASVLLIMTMLQFRLGRVDE